MRGWVCKIATLVHHKWSLPSNDPVITQTFTGPCTGPLILWLARSFLELDWMFPSVFRNTFTASRKCNEVPKWSGVDLPADLFLPWPETIYIRSK